jgi:hypothetical protein
MEKNFSINEFIEGDTKYKTNKQMLPKEIINEKEIKTECNIIPFSENLIGSFPDFEFKEDIEQEKEKKIKVIEIENKKEDEIKPEININQKNNELYPMEKIIKIFNENKDLKQFAKYVEDKGRIKENIRKKIENITTKRERSTKEQMNIKREINERNKEMNKNKKLGRKLKKDYSDRAHNKFLDDNILKKIKSKFLHYLILFVNVVIKGENVGNKKEFKFLNYSYADSLKKSEEIKLLNMTIKEIILNKSISPKYSKPGEDYNKKLLGIVLQNENSNEIIKYAFNMKFKEWIDILTKKVKAKIKEEYFNQIGDLIKSVVGKNDDNDNDEYMPNFIYCLYNYERLFILKRDRNSEVNEKNEE